MEQRFRVISATTHGNATKLILEISHIFVEI